MDIVKLSGHSYIFPSISRVATRLKPDSLRVQVMALVGLAEFHMRVLRYRSPPIGLDTTITLT